MNLANVISSPQFPSWVLFPAGRPVFTECNFLGSFPNAKFGTLQGSTGSVISDQTVSWGGAGAACMLTAPTAADGSEIKTTIASHCEPGDLLAFEMKWCQSFAQSVTEFQWGLEARTHTQILQARFSWTNGTSRWKFESSADVYSDFSTLFSGAPNATIENPAVNIISGTPISWARVVIDPFAGTYVAFTAPYVDAGGKGYAATWDMRGIPLVANGVASRALFLPFTYVIAHSANAEPGFTTDWCVSVIPGSMPGGFRGRDNGSSAIFSNPNIATPLL